MAFQFGLPIAFLLFYLTIGGSGAFLFDNALIFDATMNWDWVWANRLESLYDWVLLAAIVGGLFLFLTVFLDGFPKHLTNRQLLVIVASGAILLLVLYLEVREHNAQLEFVRQVELRGGCILIRFPSIISGTWFERIVLTAGLMCSIVGGISGLAKIVGVDLKIGGHMTPDIKD